MAAINAYHGDPTVTITTRATSVSELNAGKYVPTEKWNSIPVNAPASDAIAAAMQNTITLSTLDVAPWVSSARGESANASSNRPRRPFVSAVMTTTTSTVMM